jgi:hypothetical protein
VCWAVGGFAGFGVTRVSVRALCAAVGGLVVFGAYVPAVVVTVAGLGGWCVWRVGLYVIRGLHGVTR